MTSPAPLRCTAWTGTLAGIERAFPIGNPAAVTVTPRHLGIGTAELTLPITHHRVPGLLQPGKRITFDLHVGPGPRTNPASWLRLLSGPITDVDAQGPVSSGGVTFKVESDYRLLGGVLAWPAPGNAIGSQGAAYDKRTARTETLIKGYAQANAVTRLDLPLVVADDLERGEIRSASARFDALADLLPAFARLDGLGISLVQDDDAGVLVLDVYEGVDRTSRPLSEAAGTIRDWSFSRRLPAATQVIIGGQGDGATRTMRRVVDTAREAEWGMRGEVFVDATSADTSGELDQQGAAALQEADASAGVEVTLAETSAARYGRTLHVGDVVRLQITDELVVDDVLTAATVTWTASEGLRVEPAVGEGTARTTSAVLARAVSRAFKQIRTLRAGR